MSPETLVLQQALEATAALATPAATFDFAGFDASVMQTYGRFPLALERGQGCRVWDTEGKEYLDFVAGIATCTLGHSHPAIIQAVTDQVTQLQHVSNLYYVPLQGELATWLTAHSCCDRVFFCNSGAEANEAAIKLARKYGHTQLGIAADALPMVITAQASFHGRTLATVTATGQPKYHKNFTPMVAGFEYVPYNDADALRATVTRLNADGPKVAAILLEPLQGEGGVNPGDVEYFQQVRQLCDDHGLLLMLDEVQVGMGRSGQLWGHENLGIEPDVFTLAKGLGGGFPIGAMLCKLSCNVFQPGDHASTFGGNPMACRVGVTIAQTMEKENVLANVQARGEQLRAGLSQLVKQYPSHLAGVRGWGLINGLVLQPDGEKGAIDIVKAALAEGLLLVPAGVTVVRFVPPLVVSEAEVEEAIALTACALARVFG